MRIERFDPASAPGLVRAAHQIHTATLIVDEPAGLPMHEETFAAWTRAGFAGERRELALARGEDGAPAGFYLLELPDRRNAHLGFLTVTVALGVRRRGHGAALLRHAAGCAAGQGRALLSGKTRLGSPGAAFARAMGAHAGLIDVRRVLELGRIPAGHVASLRHRAEAAAHGYSLLSWTGPTPQEHLWGVATVTAALADAPHSARLEPHRVDPGRIRDSSAATSSWGCASIPWPPGVTAPASWPG